MLRSLISCALVALCPAFASAADIAYSTTTASNGYYGTGKAETYDVAVLIKDAGFVGKQITAVEVPVRVDDVISDYSVFLTKSLTLDSKVNVPDIASVSTTPVDGKLVVTFSEPYTITDEGVYVGYSMTINSLDSSSSAPSAPIVGEYRSDDNNFWIHTKRTFIKWLNKSSVGFTPSIDITLSGDISANAAGISLSSGLKAVIGKDSSIKTKISNYGSQAINNIDVDYAYADQTGSVHVDLASPIAAQYALSQDVEITLPAAQVNGHHNITLTVAKVNGQANSFDDASATSDVTFYSFVPTHRAIMEEYTGTWCGYCPRGFAAMQYLNNNYDDFIGIAYHNGDIMTISEETPSTAKGYPSCWLDRTIYADPYYGTSSSYFGIEEDWKARCDVFAPADINLEASFDSADSDIITVNTTLTFCADYDDADFKLAYVLVADDLHALDSDSREDWGQSNYFKGDDPSDYIEELRPFCEGAGTVYDLHFDDVVVLAPDMKGVDGSVPSVIKDNQPIKSTYTLDSSQAVSLYYEVSLIQDRTKLRVVAMLLDADGVIVNANETQVTTAEGAVNDIIASDAKVVKTEYFDLSGRRVTNPGNGLYIVRATRNDGSVTTTKRLMK